MAHGLLARTSTCKCKSKRQTSSCRSCNAGSLWNHTHLLLLLLLLLLSRFIMSNSVRPHRWQPTRLLCPWDFPGKSTGVGCHCLLRHTSGLVQIYILSGESWRYIFYFIYYTFAVLYLATSCVRLFATPRTIACQAHLSMGILQARILEWVAIPFSRGPS